MTVCARFFVLIPAIRGDFFILFILPSLLVPKGGRPYCAEADFCMLRGRELNFFSSASMLVIECLIGDGPRLPMLRPDERLRLPSSSPKSLDALSILFLAKNIRL